MLTGFINFLSARSPGRKTPGRKAGRDNDVEHAIRMSGLFDDAWYLRMNPDVSAAGVDAVKHYVAHGARERRDPSAYFSTAVYLSNNKDVAAAGMNPLFHFIQFGHAEGRAWPLRRAGIGGGSTQGKRTSLITSVRPEPGDTVTDEVYIKLLGQFYSRNREEVDACKVSVIMPAFNRANSICASIDSVLAQSHGNYEIIVCDDGSTDDTLELLRSRYLGLPSLRVLALEKSGVSRARNSGLDHATGDYIAFLDSDNVWTSDHLRSMICVCMSEKTDIGYAGLVAVDSAGQKLFYRGQEFDRDACRQSNFVDLNVYFYRKTPETDIRFDTSLKRMVDWDFVLRQSKDRKVTFAPFIGCHYTHNMDDKSRISVSERVLYRRVVQARHSDSTPRTDKELYSCLHFNIAIKIPAPKAKAQEWGDFHYASSLSASLGRLGHMVRLDFLDDWYNDKNDQTDDVVIVLRGLSRYKPRKTAFNILWNISHPDQLEYGECDEYDLVYTASESYSQFLKHLTTATVKPLYQATDIFRFHPEKKTAHLAHDILFVGNSRNIYRDIVRWAIESGFRPAVYGTRWKQFIPESFIWGENISNDRLGRYYASAGVILNDHWESMREYGFLSNRLFDCLACNATVISDAVPSLSSVFGDAVVQVLSREELAEALRQLPEGQKARVEKVGAIIREKHNFDARAHTIVNDALTSVGIHVPEMTPANPFIIHNKPIKVDLVATSNGSHFQSSLYLRLLAPLTAEAGNNRFEVRCLRPDEVAEVKDADVAVIQRAALNTEDDAKRAIEIARYNDTKLITDVDDGFILIGPDHSEYDIYRPRSDAILTLMQNADDNWFSTEHLAEVYSTYCRRKAVIRNCLDPRVWRDYRSKRRILEGNVVQLLYMGTRTHDNDFNLILSELDQLNELAPASFALTIVGAVTTPPERSWLKTLSPESGSTMYPRFARWLVRNNTFDIGLCPLAPSKFNDCKSDLKILDYAALGIVPVVSDCLAYSQTARDADCAVIVDAQTSWSATLQSLINERSRACEVAGKAESYLWSERHVSRATREIDTRISELL